jgi:hypothetical protein
MLKAKAAALKAIELDDTLAEAHMALGWVHLAYDWDWSGAENEFSGREFAYSFLLTTPRGDAAAVRLGVPAIKSPRGLPLRDTS